jgi:hypothetical protein
LYLIAKTSEVTDQFVNPPLDGLRIWAIAAFLVSLVRDIVSYSPKYLETCVAVDRP